MTPHLIEEVKRGRCVAFVGAGFSMPDSPNWLELIQRLVKYLPTDNRDSVRKLIDDLDQNNQTGLVNFEVAAQLVKNAFPGESEFLHALERPY